MAKTKKIKKTKPTKLTTTNKSLTTLQDIYVALANKNGSTIVDTYLTTEEGILAEINKINSFSQTEFNNLKSLTDNIDADSLIEALVMSTNRSAFSINTNSKIGANVLDITFPNSLSIVENSPNHLKVVIPTSVIDLRTLADDRQTTLRFVDTSKTGDNLNEIGVDLDEGQHYSTPKENTLLLKVDNEKYKNYQVLFSMHESANYIYIDKRNHSTEFIEWLKTNVKLIGMQQLNIA